MTEVLRRGDVIMSLLLLQRRSHVSGGEEGWATEEDILLQEATQREGGAHV